MSATRHVLRCGSLRVIVAAATDALDERFGPRFDRTAYVAELTCGGHAFLAAPGLCDEFGLTGVGVLGFAEAQPGETFLKIGVGRLRRDSPAAYDFRHAYPRVETFPVELATSAGSLTVSQSTSQAGQWGYCYTKTYALHGEHTLQISYSLTNTGSGPYAFEHYNHHWFCFQRACIGPAYRLRPAWPVNLPATPEWSDSPAGFALTSSALPSAGIQRTFTVPDNSAALTLEHRQFGQAVSLHPDFVLARFAVWASPEAFCPELFYRTTLRPGGGAQWSVRYTFTCARPEPKR